MTRHDNKAPDRCTYCSEPRAECCVRMVGTPDGSTRFEYSHLKCAADHGIGPLFLLVAKAGQAS